MAIQTQGTTGNVMEVDTAFKAARISIRPVEVLGWNSLGASTGGLSAVAAAASIFSFRNISANPIIMRRVGLTNITSPGFTAAQFLDFGLLVARNWTASDTGGTAIALTGNNAKHRTSLVTPTSIDCRIATTTGLTAGTRTLDANPMSQVGTLAAAATAGVNLPGGLSNLLSHDAGDYPLVLAQNEGFIIQNITLMGAGGGGKIYVNMEFAEAVSY